MGNPFQEQLLKAGLVTKKQVQKARQEKHRKNKQTPKKTKPVSDAQLRAQRAAEDKARRDRELNRKKEEQARQKATSIEINQLIIDNCLPRDESCDIVYNFEHGRKVRRIYVNAGMKQQIMDGRLGIARIEGRYELVPLSIAEKIQARNAKRVIIPDTEETAIDDEYSDYRIPDDLVW